MTENTADDWRSAPLVYPEPFPGALYDGDGTLFAGNGPPLTLEMTERLPHKALIHDRQGEMDTAELQVGDRLWLLPDTFGSPPELPMDLLAALANLVKGGGKVSLAARNEDTLALVRGTLTLLAFWEAPRAPALTQVSFPGTLYGGTLTRLEGDGPEKGCNDELQRLPFIVTLAQNRILEQRGDRLGPDDRIWLLPDTLGTPPEMPMTVLWELARLIAVGRSIALVGANVEVGLTIRDALAVLHAEPQGHA